MKRVLVVGGGFAGLGAALNAVDEIAGDDIEVMLVSDQPYLAIRPRLYEPDPHLCKVDLKPILDVAGVVFVAGRVEGIDIPVRSVVLASGRKLDFDVLVLAAGSSLAPVPIPGASEHSFNIDTMDAATAFDRRLRRISRLPDNGADRTFVIIGAGMTGIELAAELRGRIAGHGGDQAAARSRIVLIDRDGPIGSAFGADPQPVIEQALAAAGVELRPETAVAEILPTAVVLDSGERIDAACVVLATGLAASPLTGLIDASRDGQGRLIVDQTLQVRGHDHIFAAGDTAHVLAEDPHAALMSCQHARTMGKYAGINAVRALTGGEMRPYGQPDYTTCLDLGAAGAVFTTGWERRVKATGEEAKQRKQMINKEWIYPPAATTRDEVLAAMRIDERGR